MTRPPACGPFFDRRGVERQPAGPDSTGPVFEERVPPRGPFRSARSRVRGLYVIGAVMTSLLISGCTTAAHQASGSSTTSTAITARLSPVELVITPTGVTVPVLRPVGHGWRVRTPCGATATVTKGMPIRGVDVMLDPGHGGIETGAVAYGLRESDLNLDVAHRVQTDLAATGIRAALTRTGDYRLPIATRARIINTTHAKLLVSVNHNGGPAADRTSPGTEVYYQHQSRLAKRLAGLIWQDVSATLSRYHAHWVGASDAGAIFRLGRDGQDFYGVLRLTSATPGVLIEATYVSEPSEATLLGTPEFRAAEAAAIATGIRRYLRTADKGGGYHIPIPRGFDDPGGGGTFNQCTDPKLQ